MYSFLLSENSVYSELLENLHVVHKRLTQSKIGVFTFDFKMKLGSTFVKRNALGEILLYVTAWVYRSGEYSNAEGLLCIIVYIVFPKNSTFCVWEYINFSILQRKMSFYNWKFKKKNSLSCDFCNESAKQFDFSHLMSVLLQLTHKN